MGYFQDLDKYLMPQEENRFLDGGTAGSMGAPKLSDPIVPISKLGTTFVEKGQNGQGNVLQSMLASIRQGTGLLQLAVQTPQDAQVGGGMGSIGKDMRTAIKEVIKASEIDWQGLEMPVSSYTNLSGMDPRQGQFSEEKRQKDLKGLKDAILFAAEIGAGGGVDVWSQEFSRNIADADFKKKDDAGFVDFEGYDPNKHSVKTVVDERTGRAVRFSTGALDGKDNNLVSVPIWKSAKEHGVGPNGVPFNPGDYLDIEGNKLDADPTSKEFIMNRVPEWDEDSKSFKSKEMKWTEFVNYTQDLNKNFGTEFKPEVWWYRNQLEQQYAQQRGQAIYHSQRYEKEMERLQELVQARQKFEKMETDKSRDELIQEGLMVQSGGGDGITAPKFKKKSDVVNEQIDAIKQNMKHTHEASGFADAQANATWETMSHVKPVEEYALNNTFNSYAELGIEAMEQTNRFDTARPIHVGPELGWPTGYGGHTEEFINIIEQSRQRMIEKMKKDPVYRSKYDDDQMKNLAKKHISGMLDTSHLSMWYNHFPKKDDHESEESRLKRFNSWYLKQMDRLGEAGVVGSVQVVDSATGDHRHLPVGQGIFPTVDAVKRLQKYGFDGPILSEGHEEEALEPGRIQYSLWNEFGANMGSGHHFSRRAANPFGNIYTGGGGAAGYRAPPNYIIPTYVPNKEEWATYFQVPYE